MIRNATSGTLKATADTAAGAARTPRAKIASNG
jgi:hypothetical protein